MLERFIAQSGKVSDARLEKACTAVKETDPDTILFTSGTTSRPRPVLTTHFNRVNTMYSQMRALETQKTDVFCSVLPMFHCFSLTATVLSALMGGACLVFPKDRHGHTILRTIDKERCTVLTAVPTLFSVLLERKREADYDLSSLRTGMIGGSTYPVAFFEKIERELGMTLLSSLGQTEATAGITSASLSDPLSVRSRTIGTFFPGTEGSIRSMETGEALAAGKTGEICARGYNVMKGYWRLKKATSEAVDAEGWLHTGDLGKMDEAGRVYYVGRKKEIIIRGGENIAPAEVEEAIMEIGGVSGVRVVGVPDPHYIEEACALVVAERDVTEEEIRAHLSGKFAHFKVPRYIVFPDQLPLTQTGKTDFRKAKELAVKLCGIGEEDQT